MQTARDPAHTVAGAATEQRIAHNVRVNRAQTIGNP
jgi:hypothetical protein